MHEPFQGSQRGPSHVFTWSCFCKICKRYFNCNQTTVSFHSDFPSVTLPLVLGGTGGAMGNLEIFPKGNTFSLGPVGCSYEVTVTVMHLSEHQSPWGSDASTVAAFRHASSPGGETLRCRARGCIQHKHVLPGSPDTYSTGSGKKQGLKFRKPKIRLWKILPNITAHT